MLRKLIYISIGILLALTACTPDWKEGMTPIPTSGADVSSGLRPGRSISTDTRKVLLLYSAGYNSLSSYLKSDIEDLCGGWLPKDRRSDDVLLVYSHFPAKGGSYKIPTCPTLVRLYSDEQDEVVRDTLVLFDNDVISSSAEQLSEVLTYVKETFPARSYGMIFSSHATGYLPGGFYSKPDKYRFEPAKAFSQGYRKGWSLRPVPYVEPEQDPDLPAVKSVGQDVSGSLSYEMDIQDFAEAIPMKLDYLLFDACLMGGIEVAYELTGKCNVVGFSQAEVLAEGFNYSNLASHLLGNKSKSDPESVCRDYFEQYINQSGVYQSATISLVDCNALEPLAEACADLFDRYSSEISRIRSSNVQRFYRSSHHWFYDLESILVNAGIHENDLQEFRQALDGCVIYKGATPNFMNEFAINTFSGFSMYLPSNGNRELDKFYKTLKWNKATGLVR